jgi:hypothetical protein
MLFPEVKRIVSKDVFLGKREGNGKCICESVAFLKQEVISFKKIHLRKLYLPNINPKEWLPKK